MMPISPETALRFYTQVFGLVKKHDIPVGGDYRWITVVSPDGQADVELALEPNATATSPTAAIPDGQRRRCGKEGSREMILVQD